MYAAGFQIVDTFAHCFQRFGFFRLAFAPQADKFFRRLGAAASGNLLGKKKLEYFRVGRMLSSHPSIIPGCGATRQFQSATTAVAPEKRRTLLRLVNCVPAD